MCPKVLLISQELTESNELERNTNPTDPTQLKVNTYASQGLANCSTIGMDYEDTIDIAIALDMSGSIGSRSKDLSEVKVSRPI